MFFRLFFFLHETTLIIYTIFNVQLDLQDKGFLPRHHIITILSFPSHNIVPEHSTTYNTSHIYRSLTHHGYHIEPVYLH